MEPNEQEKKIVRQVDNKDQLFLLSVSLCLLIAAVLWALLG